MVIGTPVKEPGHLTVYSKPSTLDEHRKAFMAVNRIRKSPYDSEERNAVVNNYFDIALKMRECPVITFGIFKAWRKELTVVMNEVRNYNNSNNTAAVLARMLGYETIVDLTKAIEGSKGKLLNPRYLASMDRFRFRSSRSDNSELEGLINSFIQVKLPEEYFYFRCEDITPDVMHKVVSLLSIKAHRHGVFFNRSDFGELNRIFAYSTPSVENKKRFGDLILLLLGYDKCTVVKNLLPTPQCRSPILRTGKEYSKLMHLINALKTKIRKASS